MAIAAWCTVTPASGSGNGTINVSATAHTGRNQRSTIITVKATGVTDRMVSVTQQAQSEFVEISNQSAPKGGGNITITGKTNSSKLTFMFGAGTIEIAFPVSYSAAGAVTTNGVAIAGDPGAVEEFDFSLLLAIPANAASTEKTRELQVTANGGQSASATITQAAGDPTLTVSPDMVIIPANGTAQSVSVTSNTEWTVEGGTGSGGGETTPTQTPPTQTPPPPSDPQ